MKICKNQKFAHTDAKSVRLALKREKTFTVNVKEDNSNYDIIISFENQIWSMRSKDYWGESGHDFTNTVEGIEEIMEFLL